MECFLSEASRPSDVGGVTSKLIFDGRNLCGGVLAAKICASYPSLEETGLIDYLLPKKDQLVVGKWCVGTFLPCMDALRSALVGSIKL
jgi:hypothetical protein